MFILSIMVFVMENTNLGDKRVGGATGVCIAEKGVEKALRRFLTTIQILETNIDSTIIGNSSSHAYVLLKCH